MHLTVKKLAGIGMYVEIIYQLVSKCVLFEFQMPTQTKLRHSWNSGVRKAFSELDQAPQAMWDLGARGANSAKDFIKEQMK